MTIYIYAYLYGYMYAVTLTRLLDSVFLTWVEVNINLQNLNVNPRHGSSGTQTTDGMLVGSFNQSHLYILTNGLSISKEIILAAKLAKDKVTWASQFCH